MTPCYYCEHNNKEVCKVCVNGEADASELIDALGDAKRMNWLGNQVVEVRTPLRYGSQACFIGSPDDNDGESVPWDARSRIDAAMRKGQL